MLKMFQIVPLIILMPIAGLLVNVAGRRWWREPAAGVIASLAAGLSFVVAVVLFIALLGRPEGEIVTVANWLLAGQLDVPLAFRVDTLSVTMMLVVSGVGTLIHIYAIGYMHGDEGFNRFFVYMNLFLAAMLLLVSADNFLLMFVGWEGVGLCSFLLISFWFDKGKDGTGNARAGRKAFVVNRIGDFGLILAMIIMFWEFGSLSFDTVFAQAATAWTVGAPVAFAVTLLLLLGATGKSAQIPLFVWLPDAMAGPTPVSALIHAATMVTAGIYMIARTNVLFALAPVSQTAVALIGAATALLAATIAIGQFDIKRVLAYSTISQLGFMIAAVGLGAYTAGVFHLVTHAFFKALLFLAAGSVIHGVGHGARGKLQEAGGKGLGRSTTGVNTDWQDMRVMGGLRARMPVTFAVYVVGALALAGIPPLAGFFSKDEILAEAMAHNSAVYILLTLAAFCTAFYMGRQIWLVFFGTPRSAGAEQAHESRPVMTIPLVVLAALAALGGLLNLPGVHSLDHWLAHTLGHGEAAEFNPIVALTSTVLALAALGLAYFIYNRPLVPGFEDPLALRLGPLFTAFNRQWGVDAGYERFIVRPYRRLGILTATADDLVFAWLERQMARMLQLGSAVLRKSQSGHLSWNVAGIVGGLIVVLLLLLIGG